MAHAVPAADRFHGQVGQPVIVDGIWVGVFILLAVLLTTLGYGYVHEGVLGGLILLSVIGAAISYIKFLDGRRPPR